MDAPSAEAAAEGFIAVAVEQTAQAIGRISTERGFDPRDHALVAFGGAAGQIACWVAEALGAEEVLCPRYASLLSAWGIGRAQVRSLKQAGLERPLDTAGLQAAARLAEGLKREAEATVTAQGARPGPTQIRLRLRYDGADAALATTPGELEAVKAGFEAAHRRLFGFIEPERTVVIAAVEVEAAAASDDGARAGKSHQAPSGTLLAEPPASIRMFANGPHDAPIIPAERLDAPLAGPALVVRGDTQIAVAPGWTRRPGDR